MLWTGLAGHGNTWGQNVVWKAGSPDSGKVRGKGPRNYEGVLWGRMGLGWYAASGWQERSKELFDAAAEVAARMGRR
jgi:hypothetical protein